MDNQGFWFTSIVSFMVACLFTKEVSSDPCRPVTNAILWCSGKEVDQAFINNTLKGLITADLEEIHITNGSFNELPPNAFSNCSQQSSSKLTKLTKLVLSSNNITKIHGKTFHCMPNLEKLFLDNNSWQIHKDSHSGYFNNLPSLVELDLTAALLPIERLHVTHLRYVFENTNFSKLETLRLGCNGIQFLDEELGKSLCNMDNLKHINFHGNSLGRLQLTNCFQKSKFLEKIDFSDNVFTYVDQRTMDVLDTIHSENPEVNLTVNLLNQQWSCDCAIKPFKDWMTTTKVHLMGMGKYRCHDGANFHKHIINLSDSEMCGDHVDSSVQAGVVVVIVLLVIIALVLVGVLIVYRNRLTSLARGVRKSLVRNSHAQYSSVDKSPLTADA